MKTLIVSGVTLIVALVLAGCSSLRPVASKPPATVITLASPLVCKQALGGNTILPAGEYRVTLEDDKGYYYSAPAKLIRNDTVGWQLDGGLYLPKGSATPTHYYVVGQHHATGLYRLKVQPRFELKP